jgi:hypothetical protein
MIRLHSKFWVLNFLFIYSLLFSSNVCSAQNNFDLEVESKASVKTARGGEKFTVTIKAINKGTQNSPDTYISLWMQGYGNLLPSTSSRGACELYQDRVNSEKHAVCRIGDLKGGETVTAEIQIQVNEFGDISQLDPKLTAKLETLSESAKIAISDLQKKLGIDDQTEELYFRGSLGSSRFESVPQNNDFRFTMKTFPSKNQPPCVKIISPKEEEFVITLPGEKVNKVIFTIQAFDPDGTIEKVQVNTQQFQISIEYPENKYVIDGKKYSIKEVEDNKQAFQKYFGGEAVKTGKDTYTFTLENPRYGLNQIFVEVIDNGGRGSVASVNFMVKNQ